MVGVAVKVTGLPAHILLPGLAAILIDGTGIGFTVIVIAFDKAVGELIQLALLIKMQVTISPFDRLVL